MESVEKREGSSFSPEAIVRGYLYSSRWPMDRQEPPIIHASELSVAGEGHLGRAPRRALSLRPGPGQPSELS